MRHFLAEHMITADQHDHCRPTAQGSQNVVQRETAIVHRNCIGFCTLAEIGLRQLHHLALFLRTHRLQEKHVLDGNDDRSFQTALMRSDRKPKRLTTARPRHHVNRRRIAPKADFQHGVELRLPIVPGKHHHQAGCTAGKISRLLVIGKGRDG